MIQCICNLSCAPVLLFLSTNFPSVCHVFCGNASTVECADGLCPPLMKYLEITCEDEIVGLEGREAALASALSVLNIIFTSHDGIATKLLKGIQRKTISNIHICIQRQILPLDNQLCFSLIW